MSNEWDQFADTWDDDPAARAYAAAAFSSLTELLQASALPLDGAHVLDFGCGTGLLSERLIAAGATVHAIDTSRAMLGVLDTKIRDRGWTQATTSTELPDEFAAFDVVTCSSVCAFLDDYPATVTTLVRHLRPGGLFVQWDWERTGSDDHGLTRSEIGEALANAGLIEIEVRTGFAIEVDDQVMSPLMGHGRRPLDPTLSA